MRLIYSLIIFSIIYSTSSHSCHYYLKSHLRQYSNTYYTGKDCSEALSRCRDNIKNEKYETCGRNYIWSLNVKCTAIGENQTYRYPAYLYGDNKKRTVELAKGIALLRCNNSTRFCSIWGCETSAVLR